MVLIFINTLWSIIFYLLIFNSCYCIILNFRISNLKIYVSRYLVLLTFSRRDVVEGKKFYILNTSIFYRSKAELYLIANTTYSPCKFGTWWVPLYLECLYRCISLIVSILSRKSVYKVSKEVLWVLVFLRYRRLSSKLNCLWLGYTLFHQDSSVLLEQH